MKTPESTLRKAWTRWCQFWLKPGDPTTMAFLRILGGCLVLYVHLVYTFDLNAFFGKDAWYDLDSANRARREEPNRNPALVWEHETVYPSAALPDGDAPRKAVFDWIQSLPNDKTELAKKLRLIDEIGVLNERDFPNYPTPTKLMPVAFVWFALEQTLTLSPDPKVRETTLKTITKEIPRDKFDQIPEDFDRLSPEQAKQFIRDLDEFYTTLPTGPERTKDRRYIVSYLQYLSPVLRNNLLDFLRDSTADKVPAGERERQLKYLEHWGIEQRYATRLGQPIFSIWFHISEPTELAVAHAVVLLIMLMFTLGLFTRVTSVLTWLCAVSYIHRNPQIIFGQDTMMNILLFYLMIANSGATLSLDRLLAKYRAVRASLSRAGKIDETAAKYLHAPPPSVASHFAQRLLQVHFCFIYMASGLSKLKGGSWWGADAIWQTLANPEFTMIHFEWYQTLLRSVFSSRPIYSITAAIGVAFTLFTEIGLPFLAWTRLRPWMLIFGYMLHFGIGVFMGLLVFSLFMMTMLTSFLPGWLINERIFGLQVPEAGREKRPVKLSDAKDCARAAWAVAWDSRGKVLLVPSK